MTGIAPDESATRAATPSTVRGLVSSPMADFYLIIFSVTILTGLGTLMVLSASAAIAQDAGRSPYYYVIRQLAFLGFGVIGAFILARMKPDNLRRVRWLVWSMAVILLVLVFTPLGYSVSGNRSWMRFGRFTFQPSEFAKLALLVWGAGIYHVKRSRRHELFHLLIPFAPGALLLLALVLAQRDLGTGIIVAAIVMVLLYFVGTPLRIMIPASLVGIGVAAVLAFGSANRAARIKIFMDPTYNTDLSSQPMAAVYAFASGGWWGRGLGAGLQKWGGLKDAAHTDFIFAVLGEELGLFGVLITVAMLVLLARCGWSIALRSDKMFNRLVAAGITSWFMVQSIINILVVLHLLPVLGVPLPFLSAGGSALLSNLFAVGILLACARDTPQARAYLEQRKPQVKPRMTSVMAVGR